jgi:hypothetical protein
MIAGVKQPKGQVGLTLKFAPYQWLNLALFAHCVGRAIALPKSTRCLVQLTVLNRANAHLGHDVG